MIVSKLLNGIRCLLKGTGLRASGEAEVGREYSSLCTFLVYWQFPVSILPSCLASLSGGMLQPPMCPRYISLWPHLCVRSNIPRHYGDHCCGVILKISTVCPALFLSPIPALESGLSLAASANAAVYAPPSLSSLPHLWCLHQTSTAASAAAPYRLCGMSGAISILFSPSQDRV